MSTTTIRRPATGRRGFGHLIAAAVRYVAIPAPTVRRQPAITAAAAVEQAEQDSTGLFSEAEMPALSAIAAAAQKYTRAVEQARTADRAKRAARKLLDRLPAGRYGTWDVERVDNAREVADLDAIRAIFAAHDLGEVPMKPCAPSLKVALAAELAPLAALIAA